MMKRNLLTLIAGCLLASCQLTSCLDDRPEPVIDYHPPVPTEESTNTDPTPYEALDLTREQRNTNDAASRFASSLLLECVNMAQMKNCPPENIFISPLGMSNLLTMLANGADDKTREEITNVLGADLDQLNSFYMLMAEWLPKADNQVEFTTANSFWINQGFYPHQSYISLLQSGFKAETFVRQLSSSQTRDEINLWCSQKTKGMIPEFLKQNIEGEMFLANALYFNGKWTEPFDAERNVVDIFNSYYEGRKSVGMMRSASGVRYSKKAYGELISLPYGNRTYSFNIYLPSEDVALEYALLNDECLQSAVGGSCELTMPKFELEYENNEFKIICNQLGIKGIFKDNGLEKIAEQLYCGQIKQMTKLEVNEAGAKAAAVTGCGPIMWSGEEESQPTPIVKVDRPFIFSITASGMDIVLFAGIVYDL